MSTTLTEARQHRIERLSLIIREASNPWLVCAARLELAVLTIGRCRVKVRLDITEHRLRAIIREGAAMLPAEIVRLARLEPTGPGRAA